MTPALAIAAHPLLPPLPAAALVGAAVGAVAASVLWSRALRRRAAADAGRLESVRVRARALEAQLASQQLVLQSMTTGIVAIDLQHRIVSMNAAAERIFGVGVAAARGRLLPEVVRSPEMHAFVDDAFAAGGSARREITLDSASAGILHLAAEPLLDPSGGAAGLVIAVDDVTAERRLESMRSDFAANVSHELRTPITNIKGYVETLLQIGLDQPERVRHFLQVVSDNAQRLANLVEDILALSSLEQRQARRNLQFEPVHVTEIVTRVLGDIAGAAEARSIRIDSSIPPELCLRASKSLVAQALANLLHNAIQYSPSGTTVRITGEDLGDRVEIAVRDEGPGIAEKHLPRLFERFYRVDKGRARDAGGTGLGLAIVKHIAIVHGGQVSVESRVGHGSTFRLLLPKSPPVDA